MMSTRIRFAKRVIRPRGRLTARLTLESLENRLLLTSSCSDFNGDGWSDLAVGVPGDDVAGATDAGSVNVIYGAADGLSAAGELENQLWNLNSPNVNGTSGADDRYGFAVASGYFNDDTFCGPRRRYSL